MVQLAVPFETVAVPRLFPVESVKVTVPVASAGRTLAVSVSGVPYATELSLTDAVRVAAAVPVTVSAVDCVEMLPK